MRDTTNIKKEKETKVQEFEKMLGKIDKNIEEGKNLSPSFSSSEEINNYLDSL
ncbi:MAG: hypothetical protein PHU17_02890 [Candidatus Pacebacteria bacterium]|nr:hypothetical protein [Candidatus Paceibacterota bacterium]